VLQHGLTAGQAADTYILLAVGDALVAQIPGLLISVAAAMVVSRVGKEHDLGRQIVHADVHLAPRAGHCRRHPGVLGVIPGMPHVVFLSHRQRVLGYAAGCWRTPPAAGRPRSPPRPPPPATAKPAGTICSPWTSWAWSWATG
jgi:flagellar biosynthesis protein FlhA